MRFDQQFLIDCGLGSLDAETARSLLVSAQQQMEERVGSRLSEGLSDEQMDEFDSFVSRDDQRVDAWLAANSPGYEQDPIYQQLKGGAPAAFPANVLRAEYCSLVWLSIHRPGYRQVTEEEFERIKSELTARAPDILAVSQ